MSSDSVAETRVVITNPQGLHLRPADMFARTASGFKSQINLIKDGERVDGKSILSIVTLMATQGTELAIEAKGPDATAAVEALVELVEQGFWETEDDTVHDLGTKVEATRGAEPDADGVASSSAAQTNDTCSDGNQASRGEPDGPPQS